MAWTYATLVQAIKDWTEYDETTFNNNIDTFIRNCEERIVYAAQMEVFRKNVSGSCSSGNQYLAAPSDYLSPYSLSVTVGGSKVFLLNKDVEYVQEYNPSGSTGVPKYYALFDVDNFLLAPVPNSNYTAELHYYYRPASIVDAGTSWIGTYGEQALLYGCLAEAYTFMKGEDTLQKQYTDRFIESVSRLKNLGEGRENLDAYRDGLTRVKAT